MNKKILFIGCNHDQLPYLNELRKLGYYIIGTDMNNDAPGRILCNKFYNVGYDQYDELHKIGKIEKFNSNDKVFSASAQFAHLGGAYFAEKFNIAYPPLRSIELCMDKSKYYKYFIEKNIPIPETKYVKNEKNLIDCLSQVNSDNVFYLKSDQSKNPNYIYRFYANDVPFKKINWNKDRYFKKYYILQREFTGAHLRINCYGSQYCCYPFDISNGYQIDIDSIIIENIILDLRRIIEELGFINWVVKFDAIVSGNDFVILDIGLDPPYRMLNDYLNNNKNFYIFYINQYIGKK